MNKYSKAIEITKVYQRLLDELIGEYNFEMMKEYPNYTPTYFDLNPMFQVEIPTCGFKKWFLSKNTGSEHYKYELGDGCHYISEYVEGVAPVEYEDEDTTGDDAV